MKIILSNEFKTRSLGAHMAHSAQIGDVITLAGPLGAGKTSFARGFIEALTDVSDVPSPTYTLVQTYAAREFEIWHCDLYRLNTSEDILELGLLEAFEEAVCLIEWPGKMGRYHPKDCKSVQIDFQDQGRIATLSGWSPEFETMLKADFK